MWLEIFVSEWTSIKKWKAKLVNYLEGYYYYFFFSIAVFLLPPLKRMTVFLYSKDMSFAVNVVEDHYRRELFARGRTIMPISTLMYLV